ncbi:uncharacterized protein METZ01_LOCUS124934 [marine metagenome]|uniref:Uncharacterized protein n=1 Tax=marine metagenome TaxID=408172 RepID=A0A381Y5C9_9ZZZZ
MIFYFGGINAHAMRSEDVFCLTLKMVYCLSVFKIYISFGLG